MSHSPSGRFGGNHPEGITQDEMHALLHYVAQMITNNTGVEWQETAWIKESPGHVDGSSMDIAPRLYVIGHEANYSGAKGSDPVLFQRPYLLRKLMGLGMGRDPRLAAKHMVALVAVENDHIHIQLLTPHNKHDWGRIVPVSFGRVQGDRYPDSAARATMVVTPKG